MPTQRPISSYPDALWRDTNTLRHYWREVINNAERLHPLPSSKAMPALMVARTGRAGMYIRKHLLKIGSRHVALFSGFSTRHVNWD